jgi:hypothetical protein
MRISILCAMEGTSGVWPVLTLCYTAAIAAHDPGRALAAIETVADPVVRPQPAETDVSPGEFAEYFHGDTGASLGMHLSPWVAPTFIWAVMEGLLGCRWSQGEPVFTPHWPSGWEEVAVSGLPSAGGPVDVTLRR